MTFKAILRRCGKTRDLGIEYELRNDGEINVLAVCSGGIAADWNDYCDADAAILPDDVIVSVNGVRGNAAVAQFDAAKILLVLRRPAPPIAEPLIEGCVLEQPPDGKKALRAVVRSFDEFPLVCCQCRHPTFKKARGRQYTHGEWALWHLDRHHKGDRRLLEALWSQAVFPMHCELAAEVLNNM